MEDLIAPFPNCNSAFAGGLYLRAYNAGGAPEPALSLSKGLALFETWDSTVVDPGVLFPNLRIPKGHNPGSLYDIIPLPQVEFFRTLKSMDVHFTSETEKKLQDLAAQSGRATADELVRDVVEGYIHELAQTREMLNSRYDDLKSGRVKPIPGDEVEAHFREKSAAARRSHPGS